MAPDRPNCEGEIDCDYLQFLVVPARDTADSVTPSRSRLLCTMYGLRCASGGLPTRVLMRSLSGGHPPNRQTGEVIDGPRSMTLEQTLRKVIGHLNSGSLHSEAAVKASVVLPVLRKLGWDDTDPNEVKPEFPVDGKFVDYALIGDGKPLVFIEAKHVHAKVGTGEDQLFGYASNKGVPLLILTNGRCWDFYLSMAAGPPADRRFYRLDLGLEDKTPDYVEFLEQHLRENRVVSGQANFSAQELLANKRLLEKARRAIPSAWRALVDEREGRLGVLLAERVESDCGAKPGLGDVYSFLTSLSPPEPKKGPKSGPPVSQIIPSPSPAPKGTATIKGFVLRGQRVECKSAIDTLASVLNTLHRQDSEFMDRFAPTTIRKKRRLVARKQRDLYEDARFTKSSRKLENSWWLGTKYGSEVIRRYIKTACEEAGIKFGTELKLIEE